MSVLIRTDVTAVKLSDNLVLAGIGSFIHIYERDTLNNVQRTSALRGQKIHGFTTSKCGLKILAFGGKQYVVLDKKKGTEVGQVYFVKPFEPFVCADWIHAALWIDDSQVALLSAHNVVEIRNIQTKKLVKSYPSNDNSILYSGLLVPLKDGILVFAGTVFSEVIIHICGDKKSLHRLRGHKGVIFSVSCDLQKKMIVTTSDDRSVRIWGVKSNELDIPFFSETRKFWENINIVCLHEMYAHTARVMRNCITDHYIISAGEDSCLCFWDHNGKLLKMNSYHNNACIWCIDADNKYVVSGGEDSGIMIHPLSTASYHGTNEHIEIGKGIVKRVAFTARDNIVIICDNNNLIYYDCLNRVSNVVCALNHQSTYKLLSVSSCKQIVSIVDMVGNLEIYIENCKGDANLQLFIKTKLEIDNILSMHWAGNRHLVFCSKEGVITVISSGGSNIDVYSKFLLPSCRERWLTAAAMDISNNLIIVGDRCGNIHIFYKHVKNPVKTFKRVHGNYGPTSININDNTIITTGRDGTIKYFSRNNENDIVQIEFLNSVGLEFQWVEKFLDNYYSYICGFHERTFVVYSIKNKIKLLELFCGGGHRSWDCIKIIKKIKNNFEQIIKFVYVKNSILNLSTFEINNLTSKSIIYGSHAKEINCLKSYKITQDYSHIFFISGGEDTTLRITQMNNTLEFQDEIVFKQLSSVKVLKLCNLENNKLLLFSAGGRAQICIKCIQFNKDTVGVKVVAQELVNYLIKGTDRERKGDKTWRTCSIDFDPETRVMDIDLMRINNEEFVLFAGCSDALLRVFNFRFRDDNNFSLINNVKFHKSCILKTICIEAFNDKILVTCTTRGEVTFWNIAVKNKPIPFFTTLTNKNGVNSFSSKVIDDKLLICTGGDDNTIHLKLLTLQDPNNLESVEVIHCVSINDFHSSQITGLCLVDDILITTSIDQRITLCKFSIEQDEIYYEFIAQTISDVSDIQGLDVLTASCEAVKLCVYGKGLEVMELTRPPRI